MTSPGGSEGQLPPLPRIPEAERAAALDDLGVGLVVVGPDLVVSSLDAVAERVLGGAVKQMHTDPEGLEVLREDGTPWPLAERPAQAAVLSGTVTGGVLVGLRRRESTRWVRVSGRPLPSLGADGPPFTALCAVTDVTADLRREHQLREVQTRYRLLAEHAADVVTCSTPDGTLLYCSPSAQEVLGRDPARAVGTHLLSVVHREDHAHVRRAVARLLATGERQSLRHRLLRPDGSVQWVESVARAVPGADGALEVQTATRDVTARVEAERRLARLALADPLTGMPNRACFVQRLEDLVAEQVPVAVLYLDLDRFQVVNDSLGHSAGDDLLRTVAGRLNGLPDAFVARFGGDEFAVLATDLDENAALRLAGHLHHLLHAPVLLGGQALVVTVAVGVVLCPPGAAGERPAEELLRDADIAMYRAKARGRGSTVFWDERFGSAATERMQVEGELRRALAQDEIVVHYQPQIDLRTGAVSGVEALARWQHPTRGLLGPASFLTVADDTGLVVDLGRRVLRQAAGQVARWRERPGHEELSLSVNVSGQELATGAAETARVLDLAGLPLRALTVEVLESVLLDSEGTVEAALADYAGLGVRLALDDFGTGSSSLLHLRQMHVDTVKVDRTFVAGLGTSRRDEAIVKALAVLAEDLGMLCVAEGVELEVQRAWLQDHGVRLAQGFLLARPLAPDALGALLDARGPGGSR